MKEKKKYMWKSVLVLSVIVAILTIGYLTNSQNDPRQMSNQFAEEQIEIPTKLNYVESSSSTSTDNKYEYTSEYYDPYSIEDYENPDTFADEWADEFGEGDYDNGYDDAYDYWEEEY